MLTFTILHPRSYANRATPKIVVGKVETDHSAFARIEHRKPLTGFNGFYCRL